MIISLGDQYRLAAKEARKHAERTNDKIKIEWLKIAAEWSRLAEAVDKAERET
jgi:hypothetical protein